MCLENLQNTFVLSTEQSLNIIIVFSKDINIFKTEIKQLYMIKQTFLSMRIMSTALQRSHTVTVKPQKYNIKHDRTLTITEFFKEAK